MFVTRWHSTDLLLAESPDELVLKQKEQWDPSEAIDAVSFCAK